MGVGGLFTLHYYLTIKQILREMKKIDYQAPEMEVVLMRVEQVLLDASSGESSTPEIPLEGSTEPNLD